MSNHVNTDRTVLNCSIEFQQGAMTRRTTTQMLLEYIHSTVEQLHWHAGMYACSGCFHSLSAPFWIPPGAHETLHPLTSWPQRFGTLQVLFGRELYTAPYISTAFPILRITKPHTNSVLSSVHLGQAWPSLACVQASMACILHPTQLLSCAAFACSALQYSVLEFQRRSDLTWAHLFVRTRTIEFPADVILN